MIISKSASDTRLASNFRCVNDSYRIAPSLDLGLLSHRDLPHPGLCLYAYSRSGLKTLAYSTLPVQTMARIAATEEADDICAKEDVSSAEEQAASSTEGDAHMRDPQRSTQDNQMDEDSPPQLHVPKLKYVVTPEEVHDYYLDPVNTLRYSPPAHISDSLVRIQSTGPGMTLNQYSPRMMSGFENNPI